jgi:tagatose-6-phosphate ketose/aldose isomerase
MRNPQITNKGSQAKGTATHSEIFQQPLLWPVTLEIAGRRRIPALERNLPAVITGAGSSAYAALAVAESWRGARAIPTTDLLLDPRPFLKSSSVLVSMARSGDSPESLAVIEKIRKLFPDVQHVAITCNSNGKLANAAGVEAIVLDPRTNDRSLAMTSSFSNLVLAGTALCHAEELEHALPRICQFVESHLSDLEDRARIIALRPTYRMVALASRPLYGAAREAALEVLEMTAGQCAAFAETFLGLRHGPMSFLRADSLVLCFLSSDARVRRYEEDLIAELREKGLGHIVAITGGDAGNSLFHESIPASAADLPDILRTPFEIVFPQLLAYHLSLQADLDPDNPSPEGVITRVVKGFQLHES